MAYSQWFTPSSVAYSSGAWSDTNNSLADDGLLTSIPLSQPLGSGDVTPYTSLNPANSDFTSFDNATDTLATTTAQKYYNSSSVIRVSDFQSQYSTVGIQVYTSSQYNNLEFNFDFSSLDSSYNVEYIEIEVKHRTDGSTYYVDSVRARLFIMPPNPKASTLRDAFNGEVIDTGKWYAFNNSQSSVSGGLLHMSTTDSNPYGGISSQRFYDLTNSSVKVEVESFNLNGTYQEFIPLQVESGFNGDYYLWQIQKDSTGTIKLRGWRYYGDYKANLFTLNYNATQHVSFILNNSDGKTKFQTANASGIVTTHITATDPFDLSSVKVASYIGWFGGTNKTATASIRGINPPITYDLSASGALLLGGSLDTQQKHTLSISGGLILGGGLSSTLRGLNTIAPKSYLYKVYDENGVFQGIWDDVISEPSYTKEINSPGSSMDLELARNSDSKDRQLDVRTLEDGTIRTVEDGRQRSVFLENKPRVGPGSDVNYNNRVEVWEYYGGEDVRETEDFQVRLTEDGEQRSVVLGAPNGMIKFSGFISQINTKYGDAETTQVTLMSYGYDLDQYVYDTASGATTVTHNTVDPSTIVTAALDRFNSVAIDPKVDYEPASIDLTNTVVSYTYRSNTYLEVIEKALELAPSGWYWSTNLGTGMVNLHSKAATPKHTFYLGQHIRTLDLRSSIEDVVNEVLFTGGGDPAMYRRYTRTPAQYTRRGLNRLSDGRVTLAESADILSAIELDENNKIKYKTTIEILDKAYDIENIDVGDTVGFRNFGNYVDDLVLQIVGLTYSPDMVQLQLESLAPPISKRLQDIRRNLDQVSTANVPASPTLT